MDQTTALQIALDLPEVQKLIPSGMCEILKFHVEPGFRATLVLREASLPPTDSNSPSTDNTNRTADNTSSRQTRTTKEN